MLRVYAWNPNGIRSLIKKNANDLETFVKSEHPDVVFFTETKSNLKMAASIEKDILSVFRRADETNWQVYQSHCHVPGRYGTLAIVNCNRVQVHQVQYGLTNDGVPEQEGRVIAMEVSPLAIADHQKWWLVGLYVPNSGQGLVRLNYKIEWLAKLQSFIRILGQNVIVIGDINVAPDKRDLCHPQQNEQTPGYTLQEREKFAQMMQELDFVDVWRELNPLPLQTQGYNGSYTFWSSQMRSRDRNAGWRIDLVLLPKSQIKNVIECKIHQTYIGSDHCPISVVLR